MLSDPTATHLWNCESMCKGCPFNAFTEESVMAQNLGCLPSAKKIHVLCEEVSANWSCHEQDGRLCSGFVASCLDNGFSFKGRPMLSTETYLRHGTIKILF